VNCEKRLSGPNFKNPIQIVKLKSKITFDAPCVDNFIKNYTGNIKKELTMSNHTMHMLQDGAFFPFFP
jgi:hypothetical protein